jgi:hypothetical protein
MDFTFLQCVAVHTAVQRKKARLQGGPIDDPPCPHCKKRIVAQSVNITLQNIITERLSLRQIMRQAEVQSVYPKLPVRGQQLYEDLLTPARTSVNVNPPPSLPSSLPLNYSRICLHTASLLNCCSKFQSRI